jgi:hypothetical protein
MFGEKNSIFNNFSIIGQNIMKQIPCTPSHQGICTYTKNIVKGYRNPSLGFVTKARVCKVASQEGSLGVTSHAPRNVGKCEGMNPHTSKGAFHFGNWNPNGLPNFHRAISGVKTQFIEELFISLQSYRQGLQLCFGPHLHQRSAQKVMGLQSCMSSSCENFGIPTWKSRDKMPFRCGPCGEAQSIL